eukprot:g19623.t1
MTGQEAFKLFSEDPSLADAYHEGFRAQAAKWPKNPLDEVIRWLKKELENRTVHSFDLVPINSRVTACNLAKVPLPKASLDVAIFCLALMGTDWIKFVTEARRCLKLGGLCHIVEVESRFAEIDAVVRSVDTEVIYNHCCRVSLIKDHRISRLSASPGEARQLLCGNALPCDQGTPGPQIARRRRVASSLYISEALGGCKKVHLVPRAGDVVLLVDENGRMVKRLKDIVFEAPNDYATGNEASPLHRRGRPLRVAAGAMADRPKGRLILKVSVDLGLEPDGAAPSSETPVILVHENDDAQTLAVQFCAEHGLHQDLVLPLAAHIIESLDAALGSSTPHGRAAARRTEAERQVHFFRNVSNRQRQAASAESTPKQRCCGTESRGSRSTAQATAAQGNSPRFLRLFEEIGCEPSLRWGLVWQSF